MARSSLRFPFRVPELRTSTNTRSSAAANVIGSDRNVPPLLIELHEEAEHLIAIPIISLENAAGYQMPVRLGMEALGERLHIASREFFEPARMRARLSCSTCVVVMWVLPPLKRTDLVSSWRDASET